MGNEAIFPVEENISKRLKLIYEGDSRLVVERRHGLLFKETVDLVFSLLFLIFVCVILLFISFIFPLMLGILLIVINVVDESTMKESPFILTLFLILSFLLLYLFVFHLMLPIIYRKNIERVIVDKDRKTIRFEKEAKLERQYPTSVVKNVQVVVDSYDAITVYLDSNVKSIYIIGNRETYDNKKKLEIAHKLAEFLGVPVREKT